MSAQRPRLAPTLSPHGHLRLAPSDDAPELDHALAQRLNAAFELGSGHGLLQLGGAELAESLSPALGYWRQFAARYVTAVCQRREGDALHSAVALPDVGELQTLVLGRPAMAGAEYFTTEVLAALWTELDEAFSARLSEHGASVQLLLAELSPQWNVVGRVHFNLAEHRQDADMPFAFLASYTHQLSAHGKAQHLPLGEALREYAGTKNRERLLSLLLPVQRAAERCAWLKGMVDSGEIFHPLRWSPDNAFRFLCDVPELERAGVIVRMPANWNANRPARPVASATLGAKPPAGIGVDALLDFSINLTLNGDPLTAHELTAILAGTQGLAFIRGQWVEVDPERLQRMMERFRHVERIALEQGLTFLEATRMLSGVAVAGDDAALDPEWSRVNAGPWLAGVLASLRTPDAIAHLDTGTQLRGTLRPYQDAGVRWLHLLSRLGLGACLADDMGLGKTIQVLALLLVLKRERKGKARPSVLVAPASLLANWEAEIENFAPTLRAIVAHPSAMAAVQLREMDAPQLAKVDLVITTYGSLLRYPWLAATTWDLAILDEAQAIKNPGSQQTRAAKKIKARARVALTGTPVENRLSDLWSIFDFINPGLLGNARQFSTYSKRLSARPQNPFGPLRDLVRPYILRRLKTDRSVISDLPAKTELKAFCQLSRKQAALYIQAVDELRDQLTNTLGIKRKGIVLAYLMRFKQICNHPSQWLGDGVWSEADSGKLARLRELSDIIAAKQEKALVFTQFRETTAPLARFLGEVFGRPGLVLHGGTAVKKRRELVRQFQEDETVPFFVISLKAGGSGLNLTAASHVVHFDRWWNPAVENQATDRAFRIGQTRNVLVHKFVCRGTVEEKIDALIEAKYRLTTELLEGGAELNLTELGDDALLRLVTLDINTAMSE